MKSNIKKNYILRYLQSKFDDNTQEFGFVMGIDGSPLYQPITKEGTKGNPNEFSFVDEDTYEVSKVSHIPVSFPVIEADYASLANIDQSQKINSSSWSVVASFLLYIGDINVHNAMVYSIEEFRDRFLGKIDFMEGREIDYESATTAPTVKWYLTTTSASDVVPGGVLTINGDRYLEYTLQIDLEVNDDLSMGNQFEFYFKKTSSATYEQVLPIQTSWGSSNGLNGQQLLNNTELTDTRRAKMIHNIVASRGWAVTFTFLFDDTKPIIVDLFKETYSLKDTMNTPYSLSAKYKKKTMVKEFVSSDVTAYNSASIKSTVIPQDFSALDSEDFSVGHVVRVGTTTFVYYIVQSTPTFAYDSNLAFEYDLIPSDSITEIVYGDKIIFTIGFTPSWIEVA